MEQATLIDVSNLTDEQLLQAFAQGIADYEVALFKQEMTDDVLERASLGFDVMQHARQATLYQKRILSKMKLKDGISF